MNDELGAQLDAERTAVETEVIVLRLAPCSAGIIAVVYLALAILVLDALFEGFFGFPVAFQDMRGAALYVRADEYMQGFLALAQDVVRTASNDDAVSFFGKLLDDFGLLNI